MPDCVYMLDTNVFNHVLDGRVGIESLVGKHLVATHIQAGELRKTKDENRKNKLLGIFRDLVDKTEPTSSFVVGISVVGGARVGAGGVVPTESAVWDVSQWGAAKWGAEGDILTGMRQALDAVNKRKQNNTEDALIAETAIRNGYILITSDSDLFLIVTKYGGACANALLFQALQQQRDN